MWRTFLPDIAKTHPQTSRASKTFCDYKPAFEEKISVARYFTKGGGLSSEILESRSMPTAA